MHHMDAEKMQRVEGWRELHKNATSHSEQFLETKFHETKLVRSTYIWSLKPHK